MYIVRTDRGESGEGDLCSALDAEVFGAFFVQPSLGLRELVQAAASCIIFMACVVVGRTVVCSIVLRYAVVVLQSGCGCIVQLIPAVVAVRGRIPLHLLPSLWCPIHKMSLLPPLWGKVSQEVAILHGSIICTAPGKRQGIPVDVAALRGCDSPSYL